MKIIVSKKKKISLVDLLNKDKISIHISVISFTAKLEPIYIYSSFHGLVALFQGHWFRMFA